MEEEILEEKVDEQDYVTLLTEMAVHYSSYLNAKINYAELSAKEIFFKIVLGIGAVFLSLLVLAIALGFFFYGIAGGLGEALGGKLWLGCLITGSISIVVVTASFKIFLSQNRKRSLKNRMREYAQELQNSAQLP